MTSRTNFKHFIDLVSQKDILFSVDPQRGLEGMLHNKLAVVTYARGLDFSAQSITPAGHFDFQKPYVEAWQTVCRRRFGCPRCTSIHDQPKFGLGKASGDAGLAGDGVASVPDD